jgi:hypothetical protein
VENDLFKRASKSSSVTLCAQLCQIVVRLVHSKVFNVRTNNQTKNRPRISIRVARQHEHDISKTRFYVYLFFCVRLQRPKEGFIWENDSSGMKHGQPHLPWL